MDHPLTFQLASTETEVLLHFDKASFPAEVASVERAYQQLQTAQRTGNPQRIHYATLQLHQSPLALLRAPSHHESLKRGHEAKRAAAA